MDGAVPARLHRAARPDLPPPRRARDGRHGRVRSRSSDDAGAERGARWRRCAPTSCARCGDGHDGTWVAHPGLVPVAQGVFDARMLGSAEPARAAARRRAASSAARPARRRLDGRDHRGGPAPRTSSVGIQYLEAWLRGSGSVPHLQPDGRRRDRGDLARAGLAVDAPRPRELDDGARSTRELVAQIRDEELARRVGRAPASRRGARAIFERAGARRRRSRSS